MNMMINMMNKLRKVIVLKAILSTRLQLVLQANTAMIVSYIRWTISYP